MELRVKTRKEGEDPQVFSSSIAPGEARKVYFPLDIPDERKAKCLPPISKLLSICVAAGFEVASTSRFVDNSTWNILETLDDSISGALYCLKRDDSVITPVDNIPKSIVRGWDFALWYCFAAGAKTNDYNDGFKIPRVTSMLSAEKGTWGGAAGKYTDLDRVQSVVRLAAQNMSHHLGPVRKFLKHKGYFSNKFVGKKPVSGLYTNDEYTLLEKEWESRKVRIEGNFDSLPVSFKDIGSTSSLNNLLSNVQVGHSKDAKTIEDAKQKRIPDLLITEGRGRTQKKVIAKGGSLPEKLKSVNGGDSVRTIAKLLYSPYYNGGLSQGDFVTICLTETKDKNMRYENTYMSELMKQAQDRKSKLTQLQVEAINNYGSIQLVVQTYLEVIPDKVGNTAWDSTFGVYKLK
jgi:hypothetical protein